MERYEALAKGEGRSLTRRDTQLVICRTDHPSIDGDYFYVIGQSDKHALDAWRIHRGRLPRRRVCRGGAMTTEVAVLERMTETIEKIADRLMQVIAEQAELRDEVHALSNRIESVAQWHHDLRAQVEHDSRTA